LTDEDLQALEAMIIAKPNAGAVMRGTGGVRKARFAPPSRHSGKSGATRVCYVAVIELSRVYLLDVFAKNEKDNLSASERNRLREWVVHLRGSAERNG
jgi:hypothetical protein